MKRVMLVNDSRLENIILSDMLRMSGYEVRISEETHALDDFKVIAPDIVFVNYIMKTMRGDSLVGMFKLMRPDLVCVLTTSSDVEKDAFRHRKVDAVLHTPTDANALRDTIAEADEVCWSRLVSSRPVPRG